MARHAAQYLQPLEDCLTEAPLETGWCPKAWHDRAEQSAAKAWRLVAERGELLEELRAFKEENRRLREEVERLTTGKQRISYHAALRHRDLEIRRLKEKIQKAHATNRELAKRRSR
jgi:hypothetical protein